MQQTYFNSKGEEEWQQTMKYNELNSQHSPLPPEPWRCVIQARDRLYSGKVKRHDVMRGGQKNRGQKLDVSQIDNENI